MNEGSHSDGVGMGVNSARLLCVLMGFIAIGCEGPSERQPALFTEITGDVGLSEARGAQLLQEGFDSYLAMPFDIRDLIQLIEEPAVEPSY